MGNYDLYICSIWFLFIRYRVTECIFCLSTKRREEGRKDKEEEQEKGGWEKRERGETTKII